MKKKGLIAFAVFASLLLIFILALFRYGTVTYVHSNAPESDAFTTPEVALAVALDDARVTRDEVTDLSYSSGTDYRGYMYRVHFYSDRLQSNFEYEIDPDTGAIHSRVDHRYLLANSEAGSDTAMIYETQALNIALEDTGLDRDDLDTYLVYNAIVDDAYVWQVQFTEDNNAYDYTLAQKDGAVIKKSIKTLDKEDNALLESVMEIDEND